MEKRMVDGTLCADDLRDLQKWTMRERQEQERKMKTEEDESKNQEKGQRLKKEQEGLWQQFQLLPDSDRRRLERKAQEKNATPGGVLWKGTIAELMRSERRSERGPESAGEIVSGLVPNLR